MLTVVCENKIIIWIFLTESKWASVRIILLIPKALKKKNNPFRHVKVDEDGDLEILEDVINLIFDGLKINMEIIDGYAS